MGVEYARGQKPRPLILVNDPAGGGAEEGRTHPC